MTLKKIGAGKLPQPQNSESFVSRATVVLGLSERACVHLRGVVARYKAKAAAGFALASATASSTDLTREQLEEHKVGINEHTAAALLYAEHDAQWHLANPEYAAQYYQDHRDERLEYQARYYQEHRDEVLEYAARWREANPEYGAQWREANPDYAAQYYEEHRAERLEYQAQRREAERAAIELRIAASLADPSTAVTFPIRQRTSVASCGALRLRRASRCSCAWPRRPPRWTRPRRVIHDVIPTLTASGSYTEAEKEATVLHNIKLLHEQVAVGLLELRSSRPAEGGEGYRNKGLDGAGRLCGRLRATRSRRCERTGGGRPRQPLLTMTSGQSPLGAFASTRRGQAAKASRLAAVAARSCSFVRRSCRAATARR